MPPPCAPLSPFVSHTHHHIPPALHRVRLPHRASSTYLTGVTRTATILKKQEEKKQNSDKRLKKKKKTTTVMAPAPARANLDGLGLRRGTRAIPLLRSGFYRAPVSHSLVPHHTTPPSASTALPSLSASLGLRTCLACKAFPLVPLSPSPPAAAARALRPRSLHLQSPAFSHLPKGPLLGQSESGASGVPLR